MQFINNNIYLDGGSTMSLGIEGTGIIVNNVLWNENWNGVGISGGSSVHFNSAWGFATAFETCPE